MSSSVSLYDFLSWNTRETFSKTLSYFPYNESEWDLSTSNSQFTKNVIIRLKFKSLSIYISHISFVFLYIQTCFATITYVKHNHSVCHVKGTTFSKFSVIYISVFSTKLSYDFHSVVWTALWCHFGTLQPGSPFTLIIQTSDKHILKEKPSLIYRLQVEKRINPL